MEHVPDRAAESSAAEDAFVSIFTELFGLDKVAVLSPEHPVIDITGRTRYVDFALSTVGNRVAIEIDGLAWHHPEAVSIEAYEDALLRQNSLVHFGWKVFRWTDHEVLNDPNRVKEQLLTFLRSVPGLREWDDYLPKQLGGSFDLRQHQKDALGSLKRLREEGKTIALLTHATGTGKTVTAMEDAKAVGGRVLYIAHTTNLVTQTFRAFRRHWPAVSVGRYQGKHCENGAQVVAGSVQSVSQHFDEFGADDFSYLIIDEAHHAASDSYRAILKYFNPHFTLGLTATPERADGQDLLELFRDCAHRLSLEEAVERGELVPIRCVRVGTNVNLEHVRFSGVQYNRKDLEQTLRIPARDKLIVRTYLDHVPGAKGVTFCVNIRHAEDLTALYQAEGVPAKAVSGRLATEERAEVLASFARGDIRMLCACDVLNEGWDCPDVQVLLMGRPTLSKVLYMQQLGRGTRKAPGKRELIVFDFVDNASRYSIPMSLHRVVGKGRYRPGELVLGPEDLLKGEEDAIRRGEKPDTLLNIGLWVQDLQEIDLFSWQNVVQDMLSVTQMEQALRCGEGRVRNALSRGDIFSDHEFSLGGRVYQFFHENRVDEVRETLGLPQVTAASITGLFMDFVKSMDMSSSYKPVMLLALLDNTGEDGRARIRNVAESFAAFYLERARKGEEVEKGNMRMRKVLEMDVDEVTQLIFGMPFEKFERRGFLRYNKKDLQFVEFDRYLWRRLTQEDLEIRPESTASADSGRISLRRGQL